jgi:hypothetical protein
MTWKMRLPEEEIGEIVGWHGQWCLRDRGFKPEGQPWRRLYLLAPEEKHLPKEKRSKRRKLAYHFAWNGERLSRNSDAVQLLKNYPAVHAAVFEMCKKAFN